MTSFTAADHADPEGNDKELPSRAGDYSLSGRIDPGSLAHTFRAFDRRFPRREVRLRLDPKYAITTPCESFVRAEAAALAAVDDPHVTPMIDFGTDPFPWIVLPRRRGKTLADLIAAAHGDATNGRPITNLLRENESKSSSARECLERFPAARALFPRTKADLRTCLHMVERIARGVVAIHDAGFVHAEIVPRAVAVEPDDRIRIEGLELAIDDRSRPAPESGTRNLIGVPLYFAPEEIEKGRSAVDRTTDVHHLGHILYQCLTLEPVPVSTDRESLYHQITAGLRRPVRDLNSAVPKSVAALIDRAMARDQSARFADARAFLQALCDAI